MMRNQKVKMTAATPTLVAKMRSSAPRSWRWPAARRTSFQAWSTRLAAAIVIISDARQPSITVLIPAVT
jgi:hypothetical protein